MKDKCREKGKRRERSKRRIRKRLSGTPDRPRLIVYRGLRNIEVQVVDDTAQKTIFSVNSRSIPPQKIAEGQRRKVAIGKALGKAVAEKAKERQITRVVFDRGGYRYHGRVKAVAEGAREGGLEF